MDDYLKYFDHERCLLARDHSSWSDRTVREAGALKGLCNHDPAHDLANIGAGGLTSNSTMRQI